MIQSADAAEFLGFARIQLVDGVLEILKVLEILVYACEPHVGDFVEIAQWLENRLADFF